MGSNIIKIGLHTIKVKVVTKFESHISHTNSEEKYQNITFEDEEVIPFFPLYCVFLTHLSNLYNLSLDMCIHYRWFLLFRYLFQMLSKFAINRRVGFQYSLLIDYWNVDIFSSADNASGSCCYSRWTVVIVCAK